MPTISVIVPVYKVEAYIRRCIDSILAQTFSDFELILIDDGSPDNCGKICDEYAEKDSRIHVIHQENGGLSAARNAGIDWAFANSDSGWLTFIDSDDWVHPEYLERLYNAAIENNVAVSVCGYVETNGDEPDIAEVDMEPQIWTPEDFYVEHNVNAVIACAKLYRKECFQTIRYPVGKIHEDEFVTYRILFAENQVVVILAPLYFYYTNFQGIIRSGQSRFKSDKYDAIEGQIQFFFDNRFYEAERAQIRMYLCLLHEKFQWFKDNKHQDRKFFHTIQKKRKKYLIKYSLRLTPSVSSDAWVLTKVFPISMWVYWHIKAVLRKLRIIE